MNTVSFGRKPRVIVTDDDKTYKKPSKLKTAGAVFVGNMAGVAVIMGSQKLSAIPVKNFLKNTSQINNSSYENVIDVAFEKTGLKEAGVKIINATQKSSNKIVEVMKEELPKSLKNFMSKNKNGKQIGEVINEMYHGMAETTIAGKNAFFAPKTNNIIVSKNKMAFAAFHEMGHAINKNLSKFGKVLQKSRKPGMALASFAMMAALLKRKKVDGEQPKNKIDKATTFVKNHATGFALLGTLPTVLEEGLASLRASKMTKGLLSAADHKALNKFNAKALLTYVGIAAGITGATYVMGKVRDSIAKPKEIV